MNRAPLTASRHTTGRPDWKQPSALLHNPRNYGNCLEQSAMARRMKAVVFVGESHIVVDAAIEATYKLFADQRDQVFKIAVLP